MTIVHVERQLLPRAFGASVARYRVTIAGTDQVICASTRTPLYSAARALLETGTAQPTDHLCMHRRCNPQVDATGNVGRLAKWTMTFPESAEEKTVPFVPYTTVPSGLQDAA
jgi:hypothetical protein